MVQGGSQGCPLAGTFFNIGLSFLVDKVVSNLNSSGKHAWQMDDGFFAGSKEDAMLFWETVKHYVDSETKFKDEVRVDKFHFSFEFSIHQSL